MKGRKPLNVGIIGLGFGKKVHLEALNSSNSLNPVAFYHPSNDRVISESQLLNLKGYSILDDFLSNDDIDCIIIATPPSSRFDLAIQSLNYNKHLLLEKPVALNSDQIKDINRLAIQKKRSVAVNFEYRCVPLFLQLKELLDEGIIGDTWMIKFDWLMSSRADENRPWNWYSNVDKGGGVIGALGTHAFDTLHWLIGPTVSVSSINSTSIIRRKLQGKDTFVSVSSEDSCFTNLELLDVKNNKIIPAQVALSAVSINGRGCWLEIYGSKGKLQLGSDNQNDYVHGFGLWLTKKGEREIRITPKSQYEFEKTWKDGRIAPVKALQRIWAKAIFGDNPIIPGLNEAYNSQLVCDKVKESSKSGLRIEIQT